MSTQLVIERTKRTPYVKFNAEEGYLEIKGSILPADSVGFFEDLFNAVDNYLQNPQQNTQIILYIEYFNTSASKLLLQLLQRFEILVATGKVVSLMWYYEVDDFDMRDAGITYQSSIKIPTSVKPFED